MTPQQIIDIVCKYFDTTFEVQYRNRKCREGKYVKVRHYSFIMLKEFSDLTLTEIGHQFDNDHTTVYTCSAKLNGWINTNKELKQHYLNLKELMEKAQKREENIPIKTMWQLVECWSVRLNKLQYELYLGNHNETIKQRYSDLVGEMTNRMTMMYTWGKKLDLK